MRRVRAGLARAAVGLALAASASLASPAFGASADDEIPASRFVRSRTLDGFTVLETATRVYRRPDGGGASVALVGVVHIGDANYYSQLVEILDRSEIILYESVLPRGAFGTRGSNDLERQRRTQEAMLFVRGLAERFERSEGRSPASLAELRAFTVAQDTRLARPFDLASIDGWGRRIGFARSGDKAYALVSLGADGAAGGGDAALDLVLPRRSDESRAAAVRAPQGANKPQQKPAQKSPQASERAGRPERDLYGEIANALGVTLQVRSIDYDRSNWRPADLPMEELLDRLWKRGERSVTLEMLSKSDGLAQGLVRFMLSMVSASPEFKKMFIETLGNAAEGAAGGRGRGGAGGLGEVDSRIIIDERNDAVVEELAHLLDGAAPPRSVAIFYGAAHMGDFEATLRRRWGLEPAEVVWSAAMGVDEWNEKKIRERIASIESSAAALREHDTGGAYPCCARLELRREALERRLAARESRDAARK